MLKLGCNQARRLEAWEGKKPRESSLHPWTLEGQKESGQRARYPPALPWGHLPCPAEWRRRAQGIRLYVCTMLEGVWVATVFLDDF